MFVANMGGLGLFFWVLFYFCEGCPVDIVRVELEVVELLAVPLRLSPICRFGGLVQFVELLRFGPSAEFEVYEHILENVFVFLVRLEIGLQFLYAYFDKEDIALCVSSNLFGVVSWLSVILFCLILHRVR
jgi:hypothetical protein